MPVKVHHGSRVSNAKVMKDHDLLEIKGRRTRPGLFFEIRFFEHCIYKALVKKQKEDLSATQTACRDQVLYLLASDGKFYFNCREVCNKLLLTTFCFRNDLQNNVLRLDSKAVGFGAHEQGDALVIAGNVDWNMSSQANMAVMTILRRQAELCSNHAPHRPEHHPPYFRKTQVHQSFCREYRFSQ